MVGTQEVTGEAINDLLTKAVGSIYGDWNGDCAITNTELAALTVAIENEDYDPLFDFDCDGNLTADVELAVFAGNASIQPSCGGESAGGSGEGESSESEDSYAYYDDNEGLAAWLMENLTAEELDTVTGYFAEGAEAFADTPVGAEMADLLSYLE